MPEATRIFAIEHEGLTSFRGRCGGQDFRQPDVQGVVLSNAEVGVGNQVTFSVKLQSWQCLDFADCSKGKRSDRPTAMHLRVGIDPFGGTVVTSTNVIWSAEGDASRI